MSQYADGPHGPDPDRSGAHRAHPGDRPFPLGHQGPSRPPAGRPEVPPGWRPPFPLPPRPPQPMLVPVPGPGEPRGILWAFVPFLTFGYGTPFSFLYASVQRGSWSLGATAAGYGVGTVSAVTMMQTGEPVVMMFGVFLTMMLWIAGTVHSFAVRPSVFPRTAPRNRYNQHAVEVAKYRRTLREEARVLAAEDPALAHELRIGRPDLPRAYDDGGLVDVNHAPAEVLASLPGMTPELVERVVARRDEQGTFMSAEELAVDADLPPDIVPQIAEYAIFLP